MFIVAALENEFEKISSLSHLYLDIETSKERIGQSRIQIVSFKAGLKSISGNILIRKKTADDLVI